MKPKPAKGKKTDMMVNNLVGNIIPGGFSAN